MITEHALLPVMPGREDEFEIAFTEARAIITSMPGCRGLSLSRSIESPNGGLRRSPQQVVPVGSRVASRERQRG
ncbi:antibiotic biosynthesis monooxygenase family protein [Lacisediminihabitans sp. H27-G8]|uniref:antibiotic biosynthesis monooxygenase family protein n=1 Tax=Lacisediminihabitans sp. H27-G8 TaxID=3111909 RepID=UPI0038FBEAEF